MSTILRLVPPIAGDCAGALQVLSSFTGIHLLYGPKGCLASVRTVQGVGRFAKNPIMAFDMSETDAVMGMEEKVITQVSELLPAYPDAQLVTLIGSPIPAVSGIDLRLLAKSIEKKCGIPVIPVDISGFASCYYGMHQAWLALAERFLVPREKDARCINIMGASALCLGSGADIGELTGLIERCGLEVGCVFDRCETIEELQSSTGAALNLVLGHEAIGLARFFQQHFDIPYKVLYPSGCSGMLELIALLEDRFNIKLPHSEKEYYNIRQQGAKGARAAVVASPAAAVSLRDCLQHDWGFGEVTVIAYIPGDRRELRLWKNEFSEDLIISEEEQVLQQYFAAADFVFADPAFSDLACGKNFIPLVQPCISGQLFAGEAACLIGKAGYEYISKYIE